MMSARSLVLAAALAAVLADGTDEVTTIPGFSGDACWQHYAGYLEASADHKLFYWYHEATSDAANKPLVLWLNGGPGCSSLGGMFTELGPFVLDSDLAVTLNPYSFNKAANVLFIEQPAGVGFSHPNVPANDSSTALDTDLALRSFLKAHPELAGRPFYVMGESYGGHYVPNTVKQIQASNAALPAGSAEAINLKGFAVGNGYTDWQLDFNANVENGRFHALTSQARFEAADAACSGDFARCFWPRDDVECPAACDDAVHAATTDAMDGSIDIYDIYDDVCLEGASQARLRTQQTVLLAERAAAQQRARTHHGRSTRAVISPVFPTCIDDFSARYLNTAEVQAAIHVNASTIPKGKWSDCGNVDYDFNYESELPNYREWAAEGELQILIYNGDADYILSHMGNGAWIERGLNLTKSQEWTRWRGSDGQVAGYFERWATGGTPLTFLTVKGAGHMVPRDRPQHALDMFERFLEGGDYDKVAAAPETPLCGKR